jgi:AraC-like DNA-binding protein
VPVLILRREESDTRSGTERIRGEFILSDRAASSDSDIVPALRKIFPLTPCTHTPRGPNYEVVRDVVHLIAEKYSDPHLSLTRVAEELPMSASNLSRILNKQVGVSFRQLLRNVRIEEAKRMLASGQYSVKETAVRVGFSDSHYFSRAFKELTGLSASEFKGQDGIFC